METLRVFSTGSTRPRISAFKPRTTLRDTRDEVPDHKKGPGILVACDPSLHSTGFAIFTCGELTRTQSARVPTRVTGEDAESRLVEVVGGVVNCMGKGAAVSVIEDPRLPPIPGKSSFRAMGSLGYAYGVAKMAMRARFGPGVHSYKVATWKGAFNIVGDRTMRTARASQLAKMIWPKFEFGSQDEIDAALLGRWALQTHWLKTIKGVL